MYRICSPEIDDTASVLNVVKLTRGRGSRRARARAAVRNRPVGLEALDAARSRAAQRLPKMDIASEHRYEPHRPREEPYVRRSIESPRPTREQAPAEPTHSSSTSLNSSCCSDTMLRQTMLPLNSLVDPSCVGSCESTVQQSLEVVKQLSPKMLDLPDLTARTTNGLVFFDLTDGESEQDENDIAYMGSLKTDRFESANAFALAMPRLADDLCVVNLPAADDDDSPDHQRTDLHVVCESPIPECYKEEVSWTSLHTPRASTGCLSTSSVDTRAEAIAAAEADDWYGECCSIGDKAAKKKNECSSVASDDCQSPDCGIEVVDELVDSSLDIIPDLDVSWDLLGGAPQGLDEHRKSVEPTVVPSHDARSASSVSVLSSDAQFQEIGSDRSTTCSDVSCLSPIELPVPEGLGRPDLHRDLIYAGLELGKKLSERRKMEEAPLKRLFAASGTRTETSNGLGSAAPELRAKLALRRKLTDDLASARV